MESRNAGGPHPAQLDAVVVGAGFSGLYMLHKLQEMGIAARLYERGAAVGGTWFWNRYPGLQCDTESLSYSFTFSGDLYRDWTWSSRFAPQAEILDYANYVADRLDLRRNIEFNTSVESAHFDDSAQAWNIGLSGGRSVSAKYFITAAGPLSAANLPELDGLESFAGEVYHTGQWPQDRTVDLAGKRVGVIGTGSSGVQVICALGAAVDRLVVFQRTPQYVMPTKQRRLRPEEIRDRKENLEEFVALSGNTAFGAPGASTDRSLFDDTPEQRERVFEAAWNEGAQAFPMATYKDLLTSEEANGVAADFVRRKIAAIVEDARTARKLMPEYFFGTKRPVQADGYYEIYNQGNVDLIDMRSEAIVTVGPKGIRTTDGEYELDAIVFATGFDAITGPLFSMDIRGRNGIPLREKWEEGAAVQTYLGVATHGFPNMFMVQGPQSLSVMANFIFGIQVNVDWIADLIGRLIEGGVPTCEVTPEGETEWAHHCQGLVAGTLLLRTPSWWTGGNIEGKARPRHFLTFAGGVKRYREILQQAVDGGYPGFRMGERPNPADADRDAERANEHDGTNELVLDR